jgi:hypothetical protein
MQGYASYGSNVVSDSPPPTERKPLEIESRYFKSEDLNLPTPSERPDNFETVSFLDNQRVKNIPSIVSKKPSVAESVGIAVYNRD